MGITDESVIGKTIVRGKLTLLSPLLLGSGNDDLADIEVMRDSNGKPFIPGTSLAGVLKHYFEDNFRNKICEDSGCFWGIHRKKEEKEKEGESYQSAFICHDLFSENAKTRVRDGVRIDPKKQIAEDKGKYDFEVIEEGASFDLLWELTIRQKNDKKTFHKILATILDKLKNDTPDKEGTFHIGAKTNSGFGKCKLTDVQIFDFDFFKKEDVLKWLEQEWQDPNSTGGVTELQEGPFDIENKTFSIDAKFSIKNSIIIRAYSEKAYLSDSTSLTSADKFILPGTSLKGAIRHRALKILKTLNPEGDVAEKTINELFGIAGKDVKSKEEKKGLVQVEEVEITNVETESQTRIKIDRFTGGTVKTALFDTMPLWSKNGDLEAINAGIRIKDWDINPDKTNPDKIRSNKFKAFLMMQVLKDLWCEDLAIGGEKNVGRGVLKGLSATIRWSSEEGKDRELNIKKSENGLIFSEELAANELNQFAESFKEELKI